MIILLAAKFDKFMYDYLLMGKSHPPRAGNFAANKNDDNSRIESPIDLK